MKENLDAAKSIIDSITRSSWVAILIMAALWACWSTAIYLISPAFYSHAPLFIFLTTGFVLAVQSTIASYGLAVFKLGAVFVNNPELGKGFPYELVEMAIVFLSISVLGGVTFIWYAFGLQFRYLVLVSTLPYYIWAINAIYSIPSAEQDKKAESPEVEDK